MAKHTEGPWAVFRTNGHGLWMVFEQAALELIDEDAPFGMAYPAHIADDIDSQDHAHLIAAAPGGHEALTEALAWFDGTQDYGDDPPEWVTKARAAIAKARGEDSDDAN